MKGTISITTKSSAKPKSKSSYNAKTKIVAVLLSIITAFSVLTASIGSASAAEISSASNSSFDVGGLIDGVTNSSVKKAIDLVTTGNPVAAILCAGVPSVLSSIFGCFFGDDEKDRTCEEILDRVKELSDTVQANHKEEMNAIASLDAKVQEIGEKLDMQSFNNSYKDMNTLYTAVFNQLSYWDADTTAIDEETGVIDGNTYIAYSKILTKVGFNSGMDIELQFIDIYNYLNEQGNIYGHMVDKYKNVVDKNSPASFDAAYDLHAIKTSIGKIESDAVLYYTAYLTLLQMNYQCANYEYYQKNNTSDELTMKATIKEMNDITDKMSQINDAFTAANDYIDSVTACHITVDGTTKYFTSYYYAWMAVKSCGKYADFYMDSDWDGNDFKIYGNMCGAYAFQETSNLLGAVNGKMLTIYDDAGKYKITGDCTYYIAIALLVSYQRCGFDESALGYYFGW